MKLQYLFIFIFQFSVLAQTQCPINNFHSPILDEQSWIDLTSQEAYPSLGVLHAGVDIMAQPGTAIYSTAPGLLSYYDKVKSSEANYYFDALKLDHGDGWVSVYMHIDKQSISGEIIDAIENKTLITRGVKLGTINDGRLNESHLHYTLFNEQKHIIYNPLKCIDTNDQIVPSINSMIITDYEEDDLEMQMMALGYTPHAVSKYNNKVFGENLVSIFKKGSYRLGFLADDLFQNNNRYHHLNSASVQFSFQRDGVKISPLFKKKLFEVNAIPCGYDCTAENMWDGLFIDKRATTAFSLPSNMAHRLKLDKGRAGYLYRINGFDEDTNRDYYDGFTGAFNPCDLLGKYSAFKADEVLFEIQVKDAQGNESDKSFSIDFESESC